MKKIGDLMKELGFTKNSNPETQKAFVRNLVKSLPENRLHKLPAPALPEQLSFDMGSESYQNVKPKSLKDAG
jgi:hypothetical protein